MSTRYYQFLLVSIFFFIVGLQPSAVFAEPEQSSANLRAEIVGDINYFHYSEYGPTGALLDKETGYLPGFGIRVLKPLNKWTLLAGVTYYARDVAYSGQTQSGTPLATRSDEKIANFSASAAYLLTADHNISIYAGIGRQYWQRKIRSIGNVRGLDEEYYWNYGMLGGTASLYKSAGSDLQIDLRATRIFNPSIRVDFNGFYDTTVLALNGRTGYRVALPWRQAVNNTSDLILELHYEQSKLGRSELQTLTRNNVPVGQIFEPDSKTRTSGLAVTWSQRF